MTKKKILISVISIAIICGAGYGYGEYTRKVKSLRHVKADLHMSASELVSAFEKNEATANAAYLDKIIAVKGNVKEIARDDKGSYTLVLGDKESMNSVRCSMDTTLQKDVAGLSAGTLIKVKGACTGFNLDELLGSDVILNRCVIEKNVP